MNEKAAKMVAKVNDWINIKFPGFKVSRLDEFVMSHTVYMWIVQSDYLVLVLAMDDFSYKFNGLINVNSKDEEGKYLVYDIQSKTFEEFTDEVGHFKKKYRHKILEAKKYVEPEKDKDDSVVINFVNTIINDEGR